MAETFERESFSTANLGILDTEVVGDMEAMEAFLSDTPLEVKKDPPKKEEPVIIKKEEIAEEEAIDPLEKELKDDEEEPEEKTGEFDYSAFSKDLFRIGVLTELEEEQEIKTPEELVARLNYEKQVGATTWLEGFLSKFGDDRREMFDAIFMNGVDPKEYLPAFNSIADFESLDITSEDSQKQVFREFYRRVGMDDAAIEKKLQKAIDYGDLESDSKEFHPKLIDQDKKKLAEVTAKNKAQEENQKRMDVEYKTTIQKKLTDAVQKREVAGIPITQQKANEVFDFIYTPKYKTNDGKLLTEFDKFILESKKPENLEQRIILGLLKLDNFDFSKIEKSGVSKESKTLFSELAQKVVKSKTRDINKPQTNNNAWSKL